MLHPFHCLYKIFPALFFFFFAELSGNKRFGLGCDPAGTAVGEVVQPKAFVAVGRSCPLPKQMRTIKCSLLCSTHFMVWWKDFCIIRKPRAEHASSSAAVSFRIQHPLSKFLHYFFFQIWFPHFPYLTLCIRTSS